MNNFVKVLYPKKYLVNLNKKIKRLGINNKIRIDTFLITRLLMEFIIFIVLLLIPVYGIILSFLFTILFHYLYEDVLINSRIIKREQVIRNDLETFIKLYLLGLNQNNDAYLVFKMVSKNLDSDLTREIVYLNKKYNNFNDVVTNLISVIPEYSFSDDILMLSSNDTKISAEGILNKILADKKVMQEKIISSIPVKIVLFSVIFLILTLLIIILGPKYLG
ncbi:hypothetical transmembrane protein [Mycoplasma sp. CAG:956]|nr:hypothetical transmembrane protein [Mycoplasma sp. CAG:956]